MGLFMAWQTWMYLAVPVVLYALERIIRVFRSSIQPVKILKAYDYSGRKGVLALQMKKPDDFEYKSGQYMFVNCPAVSPFEWYTGTVVFFLRTFSIIATTFLFVFDV